MHAARRTRPDCGVPRRLPRPPPASRCAPATCSPRWRSGCRATRSSSRRRRRAAPSCTHAWPTTEPLGFVSAMGMLGFALPAAIGLRMARPDRPVLAVVGDGSSLYQIQALWSAARYRVGVLFVVLSNGGYAIMDRLAERTGAPGPWPRIDADIGARRARSAATPCGSTRHDELLERLDARCWPTLGRPRRRRSCSRSSSRPTRRFDPLRPRAQRAVFIASSTGVRLERVARQLGRHAALVEHDDPVAQPGQLVDVGRADEHRRARRGGRADQRVHLVLGADVDPARRVVEQEHRRLRVEPLREHDLLLVAARQRARLLVDRAAADPQPAHVLAGALAQRARAHDRPVGRQADRPDLTRVLPQRLVEHQPEPAAVAGHQRDAGAHGAPQPVRHRRARRAAGSGPGPGDRSPLTSSSTA